MELILKRDSSARDWTRGHLFIDGNFECFTCEDVVREIPGQPVSMWKIPAKTAIPTGRYQVLRTFSNRFRRTTLQLMNVPGFEGIRIHSGNHAVDTEGCLLPGQTSNENGVFQSQIALNALERKVDAALNRGESVSIVIR